MYILVSLCKRLTYDVIFKGEKAIESWFMKHEMFLCKTSILIISLTYENWFPFKRRILAKSRFTRHLHWSRLCITVFSRPYNLSFVKVYFPVDSCKKEFYEISITPCDSNIFKRTYIRLNNDNSLILFRNDC